MVSDGVAIYSMLVLRMIALALSVATIPLVVTDNFKFEDDDHSITHLKLLNEHKAFRSHLINFVFIFFIVQEYPLIQFNPITVIEFSSQILGNKYYNICLFLN